MNGVYASRAPARMLLFSIQPAHEALSSAALGPSESPLSPLPVPARELPQIVVPARDMRGQLAAESGGPAPGEDGLDVILRHDEVVELDEQSRALYRVEF